MSLGIDYSVTVLTAWTSIGDGYNHNQDDAG